MHLHFRRSTPSFCNRKTQSHSCTNCLSQEYQSEIEGDLYSVRTPITYFVEYLTNSIHSPIEGLFGSESREQITFEREQPLAASKTLNAFQMPAGDHAFLFDIPLPSKILDTATGVNHQYHTYRVEAIIERRLKSDFVVSQPVRIYQVSDLETSYLRPYCPLVSTLHRVHIAAYKWLMKVDSRGSLQ